MNSNGFRGSYLPPSRRVATLELVRTAPTGGVSGGPITGASSGLSNDAVLADYLSAFGPQELNLVVLNRDGRSETNQQLADLMDLIDLATLKTSHGREPSTFNKELLPGVFMSPTSVQEALGEWGIQGAVDALSEGLPTLGLRALAPPPEGASSPMMWLISAGDPRLGESLYGMMDRLYRPHRHMWSHVQLEDETLRWAILYQLTDAELDLVFPELRRQSGYAAYEQRSNRFLERLNPQTGNVPIR